MDTPRPSPWLRGAVPGIPPLLQPVAHALIDSIEHVEKALADLPASHVWFRMNGAASVGFHVRHLAGSTDRLFTYARGEELSDVQRAALRAEQDQNQVGAPPTADMLLGNWKQVVDRSLDQLRQTDESTLTDERLVGRAQLPSTVLGVLFHAADHAARHTGQIVTTVKVINGSAS
jgi:uncharacterized damage-inducible protein DinB